MTKESPSRPATAKTKRTFEIVASRFNARFVDGLIDHATQELSALAPDAIVSIHRVPGSFEIPVIVRELASHNKANAAMTAAMHAMSLLI